MRARQKFKMNLTTLAQKFQDMEHAKPVTLEYVTQVMEAKAIKAMFPKPEMYEPLRLAIQKMPMVERRNLLVNVIDPAYALKRSTFDNNGPQEVREMLQVNV